MLFTTVVFALFYLPLTLGGFYALGRVDRRLAAAWLFAASLVFYGVWRPIHVPLLLLSICFNYWLGLRIARAGQGSPRAKRWLVLGVTANLALLAYFKYANFLVDNADHLFGTQWHLGAILLPIGISFFTFTQIAFIADAYQKGVRELNFVHYGLFVTYFPHLVAGPVLHHAQMMPQFRDEKTYSIQTANLVTGLCIFALGLFKKIVLADGISPYADAIFNPADAGWAPSFAESWLGALAYTFQIYFDFSGYSDMAIGLSLMFNVRLPFNFDSPYRATSISDFWRRWHISLSNFLRDYLYIALGGNRKGPARRYANLAITMLLGGLWHGASWTFVVWGGLHGLYLTLNHAFRALMPARTAQSRPAQLLGSSAGWALTMLVVVIAWVFFRAQSFSGAALMLQAMSGVHDQPQNRQLWQAGLQLTDGFLWCAVLALIAVLPLNSNRLGQQCLALCNRSAGCRALMAGAGLAIVALLILVNTTRSSSSAFIYFNF